jgi:hypothetical protein
MSRQNKVNPGMYTQRGRLTQDDAAREISKQRVLGSEHTWQPVRRDAEPRVTSEDTDDGAAIAAPDETAEKNPARATAKVKPASKMAARKTAKAPVKTKTRKKKTAVTVSTKARSGRTAKAKAKSAKRRKS